MAEKNFIVKETQKLPDWEAVITGEIMLPLLTSCREEALKKINEHLNLPGFRKGMVPEDVLVKTAGEMAILEETAEIALAKEYGNIIAETGLHPIARPEIRVTKLAPGIPLEFKITLLLEPEFDLPDYKKLARETKEEAKSAEGGSPGSQSKLREEAKSAEAGSPDGANDDKEKRRMQIIEKIVTATKLDLPVKLIESEVAHTLHHFKHDLEKANLKWEEYLKKAEKTEEEIKSTWREHVALRTKTEFILSKIALAENLKTLAEVVEYLENVE